MCAEMIELHGLSKHYNREGRTDALKDVSFQVDAQSISGILGSDGAGKTTLLRILATLILPSKGWATIGGYRVTEQRAEVRRLIGYAPQNPIFHRDMTLRKYLDFWGRVDGLTKAERAGRIEELMDLFDLSEASSDRTLDVETSVQRRLILAQSLLSDPEVLLVDEPMTALPPEDFAFLASRFRKLNKTGKTILYTATAVREVRDLSDRVVLLEKGSAAEALPTTNLLKAIGQYRHARVFVQAESIPSTVVASIADLPDVVHIQESESSLIVFVNPGKDTTAEIRKTFEGAGVKVRNIKEAQIPLNDVFRSLRRSHT